MAPMLIGRTPDSESVVRASVADLACKLEEGWEIQPPVYRMTDPLQRGCTVYRLMLWRNGQAEVITLDENEDTRLFMAQRQLPVQGL
jgi:hypothetical protein